MMRCGKIHYLFHKNAFKVHYQLHKNNAFNINMLHKYKFMTMRKIFLLYDQFDEDFELVSKEVTGVVMRNNTPWVNNSFKSILHL